MPKRTRVRGRRLVVPLCLLAGASLAGCTTGQVGNEVTARPRATPIRTAAGTTIRIPQDQPFSIALPRDSRQAGLDGRVDAQAAAAADGTARVMAQVERSGTAEGLFQLGHAFSNETERQVDLECSVRVAYEAEVRLEGGGVAPDALAGLRLYARQPRGRLLRELTLLDYSAQSGPLRRAGEEHLEFTITLGPGQTAHVFLAGQVKADITSERSAWTELKVRGLEFHVVSRPAPDVAPAAAPAGDPPASSPPATRPP